MYILRHPKQGMAPLSIARAPGASGEGKMETLGTPNTHHTILRDGSDCIVVHISEGPVSLLVTAFLEQQGDPVPALRVDQIGLDRPGASAPPALAQPARRSAPPPSARAIVAAPPAPGGMQIGASGITLIGHVEREGDVVAAPGELLGDPHSLLRLEGFQVMWPDRPEGVDLAYNIVVEGGGALPMVKSGKFCGTRGEARRIIAVTFALIGPQASQWRLDGTAYFSGGYQVPLQSAVPLSGPSGLEHLTAVNLSATLDEQVGAQRNPWQESASTKVFKSNGTAQQLAS
ncbi:hypothetical protein INH39_30050 [Massilia violaceinigra]|uniref:Uncharacterized protein n=1 Tax=Massilia violaceinigra TaxID=2045208 RepID=A0ABY4A475_9BURK|nr:hypothetical protein [Massilia violaceinigra]UOD29583.1 hypothetical protein INH39_30050 [Massilia violaceinigra]